LAPLRIFFATDLHGSETCFRKFLNAGKVYQADVLIIGGDLTGKMIVPLVEVKSGVFSFHWLDHAYTVSRAELEEHEKQIRMSGCYPYRTTPEEMARFDQDPQEIKRLFRKILKDSIREWLLLAEERLQGSKIECYIMPGNDDDLGVDEAFEGLEHVCNPEGKVVYVGGEFEMISTGYTNPTPWKSPRELEEEQLYERIAMMAQQLVAPHKAIFNLHCPPFDVGLDIAPRLDETLKPVAGIGGVQMTSVGSKAVLQAIQTYQPMLGLHGHVHESRGVVKVGKTFCVNPGSEYTEGILRGCLLLLERNGVKDYLLTSG
jgi:Icc-related predicted phosphoesterase